MNKSLLKINLENYEEDLLHVGHLIFDNIYDIKTDSDIEFGDTVYENYYDSFHVVNFKDGEYYEGIQIELIHKQYNFTNEKLFGFYEIVSSSGGFDWEKFDEIAKIFNKKSS